MFTVFLHASMRLDDAGGLLWIQKERPVIIFKGAGDGPVARSASQLAGPRAGVKCFQTSITLMPSSVTFTTSNGWMTGKTFLATCQTFLKDQQKACLVVDLFSAHRFGLSNKT